MCDTNQAIFTFLNFMYIVFQCAFKISSHVLAFLLIFFSIQIYHDLLNQPPIYNYLGFQSFSCSTNSWTYLCTQFECTYSLNSFYKHFLCLYEHTSQQVCLCEHASQKVFTLLSIIPRPEEDNQYFLSLPLLSFEVRSFLEPCLCFLG